SPAATKSDEEAASEAASVNGESFVVRLFQALHASTLTCPTCGRRSSTFDPYLCVSLPLPQRCPRQITVVVVPFENSANNNGPNTSYNAGGKKFPGTLRHGGGSLRVALTLNQYDTVGELKSKLCSEVAGFDLKAKQLILIQLREDGFGSTYSNEQPVSDIGEGESLYALEAAFCSDSAEDSNAVSDGHSNNIRGRDGHEEFDTPMAQVMVVHVEISSGSNRSYRFGSPSMVKVRRDITWRGLQKEILYKIGDAVYEGALSQTQKLSAVFKLRVYDGSSCRNSLSSDIEMPLYTQDVERAYETLNEDFGPMHIKLVAEWDIKTKKAIVSDSREYIEVHRSVHDAQSVHPGQSKVSLDECFKLYTQEEKLIGEDAWMCPHCKQQQQGTIKTLGLWSLPDVLVLHLKRFKQTGLRRSKLDTLVDFPVEGLDMSPYLARHKSSNNFSPKESNGLSSLPFVHQDDLTYDLLGVSNHYGDMMGGHYIAVCKSPVDGMWREFNDQHVRSLDEGEPIATKEAYLLFYQRRSLGKDVNHRLFTGDHWAFSLSLAPSEIKEEGSSSGGSTPRGEVIPTMPASSQVSSLHPRRRSLHRSVSPSVYKHSTRDQASSRRSASSSRPLTPQPQRKPILAYSETRFSDGDDDVKEELSPTSPTRTSSPPSKNGTTRKSRPVQRQASEPGPRRGKPAISSGDKTKDQPPKSYEKQNVWDDKKEGLTANGRSTRVSDVSRPSKFYINDKNKSLSGAPVKHESQGLSSSTSSQASRHLLSHSNSLESDAKYPSSYDHHNHSDHGITSQFSSFEPASALRVKLDDKKSSELTSHSFPSSSRLDTNNAAAARRRLAQHIDLDRVENSQPLNFNSSSRNSNNRPSSHRFTGQKSFEQASQNLIDLDSDFSNLNFFSASRFNSHYPSLDLDKSKAEDQGRWDRMSDNLNNNSKLLHSNGYSRLDSDVEEEDEDEDEMSEPAPRSILQTQLHNKYETMRDLAEKHFGPPPHTKEKYISLLSKDGLPPTSSDLSGVSKYTTVDRSITEHGMRGTTQHLLDRDRPLRDLRRSSTDYSIQYGLSAHDLPAPPSPTPPRGAGEERTFTTSARYMEQDIEPISFSPYAYMSSLPHTSYSAGRLTDREIQALHSYEHAGRQGLLDKDIRHSRGARTLPGYTSDSGIRKSRHNFRPPRGTWGIYAPAKVKESGPLTIPTPCLRESSV
ncbi:ubiquitin carboxyl-terminal hydrolase 31, partial [Plakobranchus ocellatus]